MEPELSVVLFRRLGWDAGQYQAWSDRLLRDGTAFVVPTTGRARRCCGICVVNPRTTVDDIQLLVDSSPTHRPERARHADLVVAQRPPSSRRSTANGASSPAAGWRSPTGW